MTNINEPAQQLRREYFLVNLSVLLQGTVVPQQPQQQKPELLKSLWFVLFLDILKLYHMAVGRMGPHK